MCDCRTCSREPLARLHFQAFAEALKENMLRKQKKRTTREGLMHNGVISLNHDFTATRLVSMRFAHLWWACRIALSVSLALASDGRGSR